MSRKALVKKAGVKRKRGVEISQIRAFYSSSFKVGRDTPMGVSLFLRVDYPKYMSVHISAQKGEISEKILLPGDPLRAKWVAENWLTDVKQFNSVRNMFGFTGLHKGERISVMGTGMGLPSISIYVTELFNEYDVQKAIRIGTAGGFQERTKVGDEIGRAHV